MGKHPFLLLSSRDPLTLSSPARFAVATVMITTTALISFQIVLVKRKPVLLALAFFVFFGFFDGLFWGASFRKVPEGAWVPLMFGVVL